MRVPVLIALSVLPVSALSPTHLRCEYLVNPTAVESQTPRLTWLLESEPNTRGVRQTAYRILAASSPSLLAQNVTDLWDSGKRESSDTVNIRYTGHLPFPGRTCYWKVEVWDGANKASGYSAPAQFTMGLGRADWGLGTQAQWISHRDATPLPSGPERFLRPARYYRKGFTVAKAVRRAMLYISALGCADPYLNGRRVTEAMFTPGWSDYRRRAYYRAFDVTSLLTPGRNAIAAELADGWYAGYVGYALLSNFGPNKSGRSLYGRTPALLAELRIQFTDGSTVTIGTDGTWKTAESARREADLLMGETYDARREPANWNRAAFNDASWESAIPAGENGSVKAIFTDKSGDREMEFGFIQPAILEAHPGPLVLPMEQFQPRTMRQTAPGVWLFDLGQNFAGVARIHARGPAGTTIKIRYAEMVYPDGRLMTENLRKARATDTFILRGDPNGETYTPRFTYHGFQYVQLTGYPGVPPASAVTGIAVHSDTPLTSTFEASDPMATFLFRNIQWTQRSNFVDIPTDCPQRDERFGWMGDAQIYAGAASYNADTAAFYTKWLDDVDEAQRPNGAFTDYAPYPMQTGDGGYTYGTAWMDAGVIVPWHVWRAYGDTEVIHRDWAAMRRFMDFRRAQSPDLRGTNKFNPWGDWLSIGSTTPVEFLDAVYYAYSATLMAEMGTAIGEDDDAKRYSDLAAAIRAQFRKDYLTADGRLTVDTQSAYALALAHDMAPQATKSFSERLAELITANNYRMTTGFLGTYPLLRVLTATGRNDLAVRLFQTREFPSWGYEVANGATTVWERWNGYTKDKGFADPGMNSYNHYAFGAVSEWMFASLAGIRAGKPGYETIVIAPEPPAPGSNPDNAPIAWVNATYKSIRGDISVRWKRTADVFTLDTTIPPNVEATVIVPAKDANSITEGGKKVTPREFKNSKASFAVGSGTYSLRSVPPPK